MKKTIVESFYQSRRVFAASILSGVMASFLMGPVLAASGSAGDPAWSPKSSEKLIKLPASYLKKSLDHDFRESALGVAIQKTEEEAGLKTKTLTDLRDAIERADGEIKTELRHQFLAEKRAYLDLVSQKNDFRKNYLQTKRRLFERMMKKLGQRELNMTPNRRDLIDRQDAAEKRFESSLNKVDMRLFQSAAVPESKYTVKYAENMAAIEKLVSRIQNHRMSASAQKDGRPLTKQEYVRQLLADTQAELSVLEQEETVLGYMAKLVALDAMALSEQALDAELADKDGASASATGPARAVDFFITN